MLCCFFKNCHAGHLPLEAKLFPKGVTTPTDTTLKKNSSDRTVQVRHVLSSFNKAIVQLIVCNCICEIIILFISSFVLRRPFDNLNCGNIQFVL